MTFSLSLIFSLLAVTCFAEEIRITPESDIKKIAKSLKAGDSVILSDGQWQGVKLTFDRLAGTLESPIHIRAESPGGAVLTGETELRFSGDHVVVSGLVFRDAVGVSDVVALRSQSERLAHDCRITDCVFEQTTELKSSEESRWLSVYGTNNRVDHCYFAGKKSRGTTFVVWVSS